jgi:AbrB family looped-hinge helix DNA binding protein
MLTTIDAGGRVVVPKEIRDRLGLRAGSQVELDESGGVITVVAHRPPVRLQDKDGVLVAVSDGDPDPRLDAAATRAVLEAVRERRA